jgi:Dock homology region 2
LYELRTLPNTIEYEDDRTVATMKLMAYLKQSDRRYERARVEPWEGSTSTRNNILYRDTYVKYVHKLSNQHLSSNNFIEAGLTLLLHAELLDWSDEVVDELPDIGYPTETQRERKERLFKLSIDYLDKGKAWEKAIQLLGQLRLLYEFTLYDYPKLADILVCYTFILPMNT